jgi:hypothetical protein
MQTEYDIGRFTRRCCRLDRPLAPGEPYYSALIEEQGQLVRRDFAAAAWEGPPADCVGWWKHQMPEAAPKRLRLAPYPVLIGLLQQMNGQPGQQELGYLLALLLVRRRALRATAPNHDRPDVMTLEVPSDGTTIEVNACQIAANRRAELQERLIELLYCEAP